MEKPESELLSTDLWDDDGGRLYYKASEMDDYLTDLQGENDGLQKLFDLQHTRVKAAEVLWRKAHPGKEGVIPDLGELVGWLMDGRVAELKASLREMTVYAEYFKHFETVVLPEDIKAVLNAQIDRARALIGEE
jgi:hypothetical protein